VGVNPFARELLDRQVGSLAKLPISAMVRGEQGWSLSRIQGGGFRVQFQSVQVQFWRRPMWLAGKDAWWDLPRSERTNTKMVYIFYDNGVHSYTRFKSALAFAVERVRAADAALRLGAGVEP